MADEFDKRYGDLLIGGYDCVDRVVLNAYFPLAYSPDVVTTPARQ